MLAEPKMMRKTSKIRMLNGVTKLHPLAAVRVSKIKKTREDVYSFETQSKIVSSCAYDNCTIPVEGLTPIPCTLYPNKLYPNTLYPNTLYPIPYHYCFNPHLNPNPTWRSSVSNGNWLCVGQSSQLYNTNFKRWRNVHFFQCVDSVMDFPFFALRDDMERIGTLVQNKGNPNPNPNT